MTDTQFHLGFESYIFEFNSMSFYFSLRERNQWRKIDWWCSKRWFLPTHFPWLFIDSNLQISNKDFILIRMGIGSGVQIQMMKVMKKTLLVRNPANIEILHFKTAWTVVNGWSQSNSKDSQYLCYECEIEEKIWLIYDLSTSLQKIPRMAFPKNCLAQNLVKKVHYESRVTK